MNQTNDFFDSYADKWDDVNRYNKPKEAFEHMVSLLEIGEGSKVVDLGCGTGVLIPFLLEKIAGPGLVYAVDVSDKMLNRLAQKFEAKNIRTFALEAEELNKINDKVDAVICFSTFPHIDDKAQALKAVSEILKPKGRFLIAHFSSRDEINSFHSGLQDPICHHVLPDEKTMKDMLDKSDFNVLSFINEPSKYELLAEKRCDA